MKFLCCYSTRHDVVEKGHNDHLLDNRLPDKIVDNGLEATMLLNPAVYKSVSLLLGANVAQRLFANLAYLGERCVH
jgi:hypothetical protein